MSHAWAATRASSRGETPTTFAACGPGNLAEGPERAAGIERERIAKQTREPKFQGLIPEPQPTQALPHGFQCEQGFDDIEGDNLRPGFHGLRVF